MSRRTVKTLQNKVTHQIDLSAAWNIAKLGAAFLLGALVVLHGTAAPSWSSSTQQDMALIFSSKASCEPGVVYRAAGFPAIRKREEEMGQLLESHHFETGAEVGVQGGQFSKDLLTQWKSCKEFHLVDLWSHQTNYKDVSNVNNAMQNKRFLKAQKALKPWQNITKFHRMLSIEAAKEIEDLSLDFVYVDARHDYCGVIEDMKAYWPKLRPGGIMAGHDYLTAAEVPNDQDWSVCLDGSKHPSAVRGAVEEFAKENGIIISVTYEQGSVWNSWLVQKPTKDECVKQ